MSNLIGKVCFEIVSTQTFHESNQSLYVAAVVHGQPLLQFDVKIIRANIAAQNVNCDLSDLAKCQVSVV